MLKENSRMETVYRNLFLKKKKKKNSNNNKKKFPLWQQKQILLGTIRLQVRSLALLSELRICHCYEQWCSLQMQLRVCDAVALV